MSLSQEEAEKLFEMRKIPVRELSLIFPERGNKLEIELTSEDKRYNFQVDVTRSGHLFEKLTYMNRASKVFILRRLDFIGAPHCNPSADIDDELLRKYVNADIPCPHVHFYIEGFHDKWAVPLSEIVQLEISENDDAFTIMEKFFGYCNIELPKFKELGLFTL